MSLLRKGTTLAEAMVVVFIVGFGLTSVYMVLGRGQALANTTANRIQAINLAREGIEIVSNIRDTNWIKFAADMPSCWKVKDYHPGCVGQVSSHYGHNTWFGSGNTADFTPYLSGGLWYLRQLGAGTSTGVYFDAQGLSYQTGANAEIATIEGKRCGKVDPTLCRSMFNRVITLGHSGTFLGAPAWCGDDVDGFHFGTGCLSVTTTVTWIDQSSREPRSVKLDTVLTDWKTNQ